MPEIPKAMLSHAAKLRPSKHRDHVAVYLQRMVRAEAAAIAGESLAICDGVPEMVYSGLGECVCVTCGCVKWWKGTRQMQGGHMLPSRNAHIVLDETLVYPQCVVCNEYRNGAPAEFRLYAIERFGIEWYDAKRLQSKGYVMQGGQRKRHVPHSREERILLQLEFKRRTKEAERIINAG